MKKLSTLLLFFFFANLSAQDYQEMVIEGATWIYEKKETGPVSHFAYHIKGDTTINGVDYKILNDQGLDLSPDGILSLNSTSTPLAYLREDIPSKKVYALIDEATEYSLCFGVSMSAFMESHPLGEFENEFLLYDFSLEEGDIIDSEIPAEISSIEDSELFGVEVDFIKLSSAQPYYEKFGFDQGLFFPHFIFFTAGYVRLIQYCVSDSFECEILVEPLSTKILESQEFTLYPNPTHSFLSIEVPDELIQSIKVYTFDGRLLMEQYNYNSTSINLDLSNVSYRGFIIIEGVTTSSKFVDRILKY